MFSLKFTSTVVCGRRPFFSITIHVIILGVLSLFLSSSSSFSSSTRTTGFANAFSLWGSPKQQEQQPNTRSNDKQDDITSRLNEGGQHHQGDQEKSSASFSLPPPLATSLASSLDRHAVVVICNSRARRCLPQLVPSPKTNPKNNNSNNNQQQKENEQEEFHLISSDVSRLIASMEPSQVLFVFYDVRSAEAAKFTISSAREQLSSSVFSDSSNTQNQEKKSSSVSPHDDSYTSFLKSYYSVIARSSLIPCDISESTQDDDPSILACINNVLTSNKKLESTLENIFFFSGSISAFAPTTVTSLYDARLQNPNLAGISCLSLMTPKKATDEKTEEDSNEKQSSSTSSKRKEQPHFVYSAGFSRSPRYRSVLGGKLVSVLPNQAGLPSDDDRFKGQILRADAIDFSASYILFGAFRAAAQTPATLPFERSFEWCPSNLEEISEIIQEISFSSSSSVAKRRSNHHRHKNSGGNKNRKILQTIKRAINWLDGMNSDACNIQTRFGYRFDEMFLEPIAPVLSRFEKDAISSSFSSSSKHTSTGKEHHREEKDDDDDDDENAAAPSMLEITIDKLLFRLSSMMADATVQAQIVQAMEVISTTPAAMVVSSQSSNSVLLRGSSQSASTSQLASIADVRVQLDSSLNPLLSTMSFPSATAQNRLSSYGAISLSQQQLQQSSPPSSKFPLVVVWDQYCCHCCGFSSEIERFVLPLTATVYLTSHLSCFCQGQISFERRRLEEMYLTPERLTSHPPTDVVIWVSHTQPYLFTHPLQEAHPIDYHIARMMFEWSRIEPNWVSDIKTSVNEVWVPGQWVKDVFVQSGVPSSKLFVIPEAVDTHRFNPDAIRPFDDIDESAKELKWNIHCSIPSKNNNNNNKKQNDDEFIFFSNYKWEPRKGWQTLMEAYLSFGEQFPELKEKVSLYILTFAFEARNPKDQDVIFRLIDRWWIERKKKVRRDALRKRIFDDQDPAVAHLHYLFEQKDSTFRESPQSLLDAYFHEEDEKDEANLFLAENAEKEYSKLMNGNNNNNHDVGGTSSSESIIQHLKNTVSKEWMQRMPKLCLIVDIIPDDEMDRLYASADAFVLPTRGEGWGLPIIQSMSLGKPVLATRWGGELEFMTDETSFFIELEGLEQPEGSSMPLGSKWAVPSATHLTELMHYVSSNPKIAKNVGVRAREHIVTHFSDEAVRRVLERRLQVIHDFVASLYR